MYDHQFSSMMYAKEERRFERKKAASDGQPQTKKNGLSSRNKVCTSTVQKYNYLSEATHFKSNTIFEHVQYSIHKIAKSQHPLVAKIVGSRLTFSHMLEVIIPPSCIIGPPPQMM